MLAANYTYGNSSSGGGALAGFLIVYLIVVVIELTGLWKTYAKAGEHGWACIIPFYNVWCMLRMVGRPGWWLILSFIPFVNLIVGIIILWDLNKSFRKSPGFFWGLLLLGFVFFPILGFGSSAYAGPAGPDPWATRALAPA